MTTRSPFCLTPVLLVACAAIAIAGCGGDDDSSSTGGSDFVAQANAICVDVSTQSAALTPPTNEVQSFVKYTEGGLAIIEPALKKMQALTPPEDQKQEFEAYLAAIKKQIQIEESMHDAAVAGNAQAVSALVKDLEADGTVQKAAALGFTECAKG